MQPGLSGNIKIYIMAAPATGKSTFVSANKRYKGIKVIDFSEIASRGARNQGKSYGPAARKGVFRRLAKYLRNKLFDLHKRAMRTDTAQRIPHTGKSYHEEIVSYLRSQNEPVIVLGRIGPPNPERFSDIVFGAVLIPEQDHQRNCRQRRLHRPNSDMCDFSAVSVRRRQLSEYAEQYNIPIFPSFMSALDGLTGLSASDR